MRNLLRIFLSLVLLLTASSCSKKQAQWNKLSDLKHASHADYIFLRDNNKQEWVFKQIVEPAPDDQVVIILEAFASEISKSVGIPLNLVQLISPSEDFACRIFANLPGSLHLKVPGREAEENFPWNHFDIHQKFRTPFQIAKNGPLPPEELGLRREVISNMSKHPHLAKIVALDTFLGNADRSVGNVFYHQKSNSFYGIDMGSCLMGNLAKIAVEKLSLDSQFSKEEIEGLKLYRQTLLSLISHFPPSKTIDLLHHYMKQAGFVSTNPSLWNEDLERKIKKWTQCVTESYDSSVKLVDLLKNITEV